MIGINKKLSKKFTNRKYLHVVAKEDIQAGTVGGRVVHDGLQLWRVSTFSPLLVCSEHFTDIHLKTAKMIAFDDAGNLSTRATGYTVFTRV